MADSPVIIVGGDSKVGGALAEHLRLAGESVLCTSRRRTGSNVDYLDLNRVHEWQPPARVRTAILCAAFARIDVCRQDPQTARQVNVTGILEAARKLRSSGAFLVFLSTNAVFDGVRPQRPADEPLCPMTEYGRQKAEAERLLRELDPNLAIVRFAKILEPCVPLFSQWQRSLRAGQAIEPFHDMSIAPVPLSFAVSVLRLVADRRQGGIYQVSAERDINYAQAALWAAEALGADNRLVRPVSASERIQDHVPKHTTLATDRLLREFGIAPPTAAWTIRQALHAA